jgi:MFS family permease
VTVLPPGQAPLSEQGYPARTEANYMLAVLLLAYVLSFIDRLIPSLLVGPLRHDLGISDFQFSLLQGAAFTLFYATLGVPLGRLADRHDRTRIIAIGIALWSLMTTACGIAAGFGGLFLARIGVGVGEAALAPAAHSLFSDSFPPARLTRAIAIFSMGIPLGAGLAFCLGGTVVEFVATLPSIGTVKSWQLTFFILGLPGLAVSVLTATLREPQRRDLSASAHCLVLPNPTKARETLSLLVSRWRIYAPVYFSIALLGVLASAYLSWYPTFLVRTFRWPIRQAGIDLGLIYLIFGTAGTVSSAMLSEWLARRQYADANLRVIMGIALLLLLPATASPLMPTGWLALLVASPTVFLLNGFVSVSVAALLVVTPNRMRGFMSATFMLTINLITIALGTSLVALLTDYVFHDDLSLRYSLAVVAVLTCPLAALICGSGLKHYRVALACR